MTELGWAGELRRFFEDQATLQPSTEHGVNLWLLALVLWLLPRAAATPHTALDGVLRIPSITFLSLSHLQATILTWKEDLLARMGLLL